MNIVGLILTGFLNVFGFLGVLIFYILIFSLGVFLLSIPAWWIGRKRKMLFLKDHLLVFYCYLVSFILFALGISAQSFGSFFWELFWISIAYLIFIYFRVFVLKFVGRKGWFSWAGLVLLLVISILISTHMPLLLE